MPIVWVWWYVAIVNILTFVVAVWDKLSAVKGWWRIPEKTLFILCAIGGAAGMLAGMHLVRHKTKKPRFAIGVPLILLLQIGILFFLQQKGIFFA